jgi:hypothetical protein
VRAGIHDHLPGLPSGPHLVAALRTLRGAGGGHARLAGPVTPAEQDGLAVACKLAAVGVPIFFARPVMSGWQWNPAGGTNGCGYWLPKAWQQTEANGAWISRWRSGYALCAVMGHRLDLLDIDPRNGGHQGREQLAALWPTAYGSAATPSGGTHDFIAALGVGSRDALRDGLDIKGGLPDGTSRGFAFIAPTVKLSKTTGELAAYRWIQEPDLAGLDLGVDDSGSGIADMVRKAKGVGEGARPSQAWSSDYPSTHRRLAGLVRLAAEAPAKTRNSRLFWAAVHAAESTAYQPTNVADALIRAGEHAGLSHAEAHRTVKSAFDRAGIEIL